MADAASFCAGSASTATSATAAGQPRITTAATANGCVDWRSFIIEQLHYSGIYTISDVLCFQKMHSHQIGVPSINRELKCCGSSKRFKQAETEFLYDYEYQTSKKFKNLNLFSQNQSAYSIQTADFKFV